MTKVGAMGRTARLVALFGCLAIMGVGAPAAVANAAEPTTPIDSASAPRSGELIGDPPAGQVNVPYSFQFTFSGRANSILATGLPAGLFMDPTGLLTGMPTEPVADHFAFKMAAFDWNTMRLVERVVPLQIQVPELPVLSDVQPPSPHHASPYSHRFIVSYPGPTRFTATGLPGGMAMSENGLLTGTPSKTGTFAVTVSVTGLVPGGVPVTTSRTWRLDVDGAPGPGWLDGDSYHEVILDRSIAYGISAWEVRCPYGWYLDKTVGTAGRNVGQGLIVKEESWGVGVDETISSRFYVPGDYKIMGNRGFITNTRWTEQHVTIEMVCTQHADKIWMAK